jgi:hypothetical protein
MRRLLLITATGLITLYTYSQTPSWNDNDRNYLLENLTRSRDALIKETENLSEAQWNFKESADRWSIKEIVEHIGIWELIFQREINQALRAGPQADLQKAAKPDSVYLGFIMEEHPHITTESTKPFTFSVPMGLTDGKTNLAWVNKLRNESLSYIRTTHDDLRAYFLKSGRPNVHQIFINTFGHTDRHIRQIKKVKAHPGYMRLKS